MSNPARTMLSYFHPRNELVKFTGLPLLFIFIYLYFLSANLYETNSHFIIKQNQGENGGAKFDVSFMNPINVTSREDAFLVKEFIHSANLLNDLNQEIDLKTHYSKPKLDFVRRLSGSASKEDFLGYYRKMISVVVEPESNIISLSVRAFDAQVALRIMELILAHSENFINRISKRLAEEQVNFVRQEVDRAEESLRAEKEKLLAFQHQRALVNPESDIKSRIEAIGQIQSEIIQKKAALKELRGFLQADAFQVTSLNNQIAALEEQVEEERKKLTGSPEVSLSQVTAEYQNLSLDLEFAENAYKAAFTALQTSQIEASRKLKHMVVISSSGEPDAATYPRRFYGLFTAFVVLLLVYGIGKLIVATIKDHAE